jgi:hypothetical protein
MEQLLFLLCACFSFERNNFCSFCMPIVPLNETIVVPFARLLFLEWNNCCSFCAPVVPLNGTSVVPFLRLLFLEQNNCHSFLWVYCSFERNNFRSSFHTYCSFERNNCCSFCTSVVPLNGTIIIPFLCPLFLLHTCCSFCHSFPALPIKC